MGLVSKGPLLTKDFNSSVNPFGNVWDIAFEGVSKICVRETYSFCVRGVGLAWLGLARGVKIAYANFIPE